MGTFTAGAVVLIPFPFSDLSESKLRPAVVLASVRQNDWILCQITSKPYSDPSAIIITDNSFAQGSLQRESYARPGKLFTANRQIITAQVGLLEINSLKKIINATVAILRAGLDTHQGKTS